MILIYGPGFDTDYFRRRLETDNIYLFNYEVSVKDTNLVRSLTELTDHSRFKNLELTGKYKSIVIFVYGIEKFNSEQRTKFITLLNFHPRSPNHDSPAHRRLGHLGLHDPNLPEMRPTSGVGKDNSSVSSPPTMSYLSLNIRKPNSPTITITYLPAVVFYATSLKILTTLSGKTYTCRSKPIEPSILALSRPVTR